MSAQGEPKRCEKGEKGAAFVTSRSLKCATLGVAPRYAAGVNAVSMLRSVYAAYAARPVCAAYVVRPVHAEHAARLVRMLCALYSLRAAYVARPVYAVCAARPLYAARPVCVLRGTDLPRAGVTSRPERDGLLAGNCAYLGAITVRRRASGLLLSGPPGTERQAAVQPRRPASVWPWTAASYC
jgi:hypothetical protein